MNNSEYKTGVNKALRNDYKYHFDTFDKLNELLDHTKNEVVFSTEPKKNCYACALYSKTLNSIEAITRLLEYGLIVDASIILRGMLETVANLVLILKDGKFHKYYELNQKIKANNLKRSLIQSKEKILITENTKQSIEEFEDYKISNTKKNDTRWHTTTINLFTEANMLTHYIYPYTRSCHDVHASLTSIEQSFTSQKGNLILDDLPRLTEIPLVFITAALTLGTCLESVYGYLEIENNSALEKTLRTYLDNTYQELQEQLGLPDKNVARFGDN